MAISPFISINFNVHVTRCTKLNIIEAVNYDFLLNFKNKLTKKKKRCLSLNLETT